ncbi:MAG TPA: hypothetical protein VH413_09040 [Verrucomicrobiae bacterium]|jgi:hypothetical protein|nr:hypothetical protein [Verrucomicrobiae bacterium]
MEFIKKNYEKVILGFVLLILTAATCGLPIFISNKRAALEAARTNRKPNPKPLAAADMTLEDEALQREQTPLHLDYTTKHNIFNPVVWKRNPDGTVHKYITGNEEGIGALEVVNIKPLYLELSYGSPSANGYFINIERQGALRSDKRHTQSLVSKDSPGELISLHNVVGPPDHPTQLELEWKETSEPITLSTDKPFRKVESYSADLKYPPENKSWNDQRVGSRPLFFANGSYNIVAITESNVVVLAESNKKKTTITLHPATEPR